MADPVTLAVIGIGAAAGGSYLSYKGSREQAKYQSKALQQQAQEEQVRRKQMELDSRRRRREVIRQAQLARATALTSATAQGAGQGSGLQGGYGQISGRTGVNSLGISQNEAFGSQIFDLNAGASNFYSQAARAGSTSAMGAGLTSLGGLVLNNMGPLSSLGTYYGNVGNQFGTIESTGIYDPWRGLR